MLFILNLGARQGVAANPAATPGPREIEMMGVHATSVRANCAITMIAQQDGKSLNLSARRRLNLRGRLALFVLAAGLRLDRRAAFL